MKGIAIALQCMSCLQSTFIMPCSLCTFSLAIWPLWVAILFCSVPICSFSWALSWPRRAISALKAAAEASRASSVSCAHLPKACRCP